MPINLNVTKSRLINNPHILIYSPKYNWRTNYEIEKDNYIAIEFEDILYLKEDLEVDFFSTEFYSRFLSLKDKLIIEDKKSKDSKNLENYISNYGKQIGYYLICDIKNKSNFLLYKPVTIASGSTFKKMLEEAQLNWDEFNSFELG